MFRSTLTIHFEEAEYTHQMEPMSYTGTLFRGGVQQIQLRIEDRENGDLGAVAP
jgi:hypothetical protein